MAERILGLDIGGDSVKAVLLSRGFRGGYQVVAFRRIELAAAGGLSGALEKLFADPALRGTLCVTTLPTRMLSFRNVHLPFREERKIRQTLPFALEPLIQTRLDEVFIDHTATLRGNGAEIFAALVARSLVGERMALLAPYVREVAVIDIDTVPLACRLMLGSDFPESALVLDIGAKDTTAIYVRMARIAQIRHFPFGGETLTRILAERLDIDRPAAETLKRNGTVPPEAEEPMRQAIGDFCSELRSTQTSLLWQGVLDGAPERIFMTGGGSRTEGLAARLAEVLGVPAERIDLAGSKGFALGNGMFGTWDPALMDQALALAARPMAKGGGFNFRQRAFEARADYGKLRDRFRAVAVAAGVIFLLAAVEIGLEDYGNRLRLTALKKDIETAFRRIDPDTTRIVDPLAQLRGKIGEMRKLSVGTGDAVTATVLDLLKEISELAPADLLLTSFNLDGDAISLQGEAQNFDAVDTLKTSFAKAKTLKSVTIGSTTMKPEGRGVAFDLKISLTK
jgi:Tfp pilus assembly PilM family ATPase